MQIIRAEAMGMCFGVRDAIAETEKVETPADYTIHGELVHNEEVNRHLSERGFSVSGELKRHLPATPGVLITAHGVSNAELQRLKSVGKRIIDTTCPLVRRAHDAAVAADQAGWHVVVAGKRNHVEVLGLTGDLADYTVIESPAEAQSLPHDRLAIICQTTLPPASARNILTSVRRVNPDSQVKMIDTICRPTKLRQHSMATLLRQCDAIVVVGGAHSNNTRQLVRSAELAGRPVQHVTAASDIDISWAAQFKVVGLTAGTSTPESIIDAVDEKLQSIRSTAQSCPISPSSTVGEVFHV